MTAPPELLMPTSPAEATAAFGDGEGVTVMAGGTILLPELTYEGGMLKGIELIPISLGWKEARHLRVGFGRSHVEFVPTVLASFG